MTSVALVAGAPGTSSTAEGRGGRRCAWSTRRRRMGCRGRCNGEASRVPRWAAVGSPTVPTRVGNRVDSTRRPISGALLRQPEECVAKMGILMGRVSARSEAIPTRPAPPSNAAPKGMLDKGHLGQRASWRASWTRTAVSRGGAGGGRVRLRAPDLAGRGPACGPVHWIHHGFTPARGVRGQEGCLGHAHGSAWQVRAAGGASWRTRISDTHTKGISDTHTVGISEKAGHLGHAHCGGGGHLGHAHGSA